MHEEEQRRLNIGARPSSFRMISQAIGRNLRNRPKCWMRSSIPRAWPMTRIERGVTVAGITIFAAFAISVTLLAHAPFHSDLREGARGTVNASSLLEVVWTIPALILVITRWRRTPVALRIAVTLNASVTGLLLAGLVHRWIYGY